MKLYFPNLLLALLFCAAAAVTGCQEAAPAAQEPTRAKLAEDMTQRPANQRWLWWGGDEPKPAAPAPVATAAPEQK